MYRKMPAREDELDLGTRLVGLCARFGTCLGDRSRSPSFPVGSSAQLSALSALARHLLIPTTSSFDVQLPCSVMLSSVPAMPDLIGDRQVVSLHWGFGEDTFVDVPVLPVSTPPWDTQLSCCFQWPPICDGFRCSSIEVPFLGFSVTLFSGQQAPKTRIGGSGTCAYLLLRSQTYAGVSQGVACISPYAASHFRSLPFNPTALSAATETCPTSRCLNDTSVALGYLPKGSGNAHLDPRLGRWPAFPLGSCFFAHLAAQVLSGIAAVVVPFFRSLLVLASCVLWKMLLWHCPSSTSLPARC